TGCAPGPRTGHLLVYDSNRNVLILFGGGDWSSLPGSATNDVWEWDGSSWTKRTDILGTPPSARSYMFGAFDSSRNRVVIFGGVDTSGTYLNDVYEYDGVSW